MNLNLDQHLDLYLDLDLELELKLDLDLVLDLELELDLDLDFNLETVWTGSQASTHTPPSQLLDGGDVHIDIFMDISIANQGKILNR